MERIDWTIQGMGEIRTWLEAFQAEVLHYDQKLANWEQLRIQKLTARLNYQDLSTLIHTLQNNLHHRQQKEQHRQQIKQTNQKDNSQKSYLSDQQNEITGRPSLYPIFSSPQQKQYYQLKQQTAVMLIHKQQNGVNQDKHSAATISIPDLIKDIIADSYRTLETIIRTQVGQHTMRLYQHDYHHLTLLLNNCSSYLFQCNRLTFHKLIQTTYHISQVQLTQQQAASLYLALQEWIQAYRLTCQQPHHNTCQQPHHNTCQQPHHSSCCHIIGKPTISEGSSIVRNKNEASIIKVKPYSEEDREQFRTFINQRHVEAEMLTQYKLNPTVSHMTAQLKLKYADKQHLITLIEVKNKFHTILRAAYRRLVELWNMLDARSRMPRLIALKSHYIEKILLSGAALKVRLALVEVWLLQPADSNQLMRKVVMGVIREINQYLNCSQPNRRKQEQLEEINQSRKASRKRTGCIKRAKGINCGTLDTKTDQH